MASVTPYLQLDLRRDTTFWVAGRLWGFTFAKVDGVEVFDPDVEVYEAKTPQGRHLGLWYLIPTAGREKLWCMDERLPTATGI